MKLSLGVLLAIYLAGLQLIAVISVVFFSYVSSENALIEHTKSLLSDTGNNAVEHSKGFLEPARVTAILSQRLIESGIVSSDKPEDLEKLLFQQLQVGPQLSGIFYGDEVGNFVYVMRSHGVAEYRTKIVHRDERGSVATLIWRNDNYEVIKHIVDPLDTFDPRTRPWYSSAKSKMDAIWTDPYIFFSSQKPGVTSALPVINLSGELKGVFGVDIEIDEISDFLAQLKVGQNGGVMALTKDGSVIAHSNPSLVKVVNKGSLSEFVSITEIDDAIAKVAFGGLKQQDIEAKGDAKQFEYEGNGYVSTLIPSDNQDLPWAIAIYAPTEDFIGGIKENRTRNIWIAVFIALITGLIGLRVAGRISRPIREFALLTELLSSGKVSTYEDIPETYRELKDASEVLLNEIAQRKAFELEYGRTFDLASRGMAQISPNSGRFIRTNPQLNDILGFTSKEMQGMTFSEILHSDDNDTYLSFQYAVHKDVEYNKERRYIRKDGTFAWLRVNAILIRDEQGKALHTVATVDDVTALRKSKDKINELSLELSHYSRISMMGEMATGLAHELNQPLTAITQNADAALLTVMQSDKPDPELIEILEEMDQQAHRGADIIRALRGFVRKDKGRTEAFDLKELIEQTLYLVHPEASVHGIAISFKAPALTHATGSRVQVAQVIVNLLRNAIEAIASDDSSVKQIKVRAESADDDMLKVSVEDTGGGVDPSIELFTQFETSKKDGMGLGLTFSRSIIEAHGGKLWCESDKQHCTKFCFTLPILSISQQESSDDQ
ncbi:sensor histidine kinase [Leucothrix arctica]|uniref:histidine kinase n=1 Tax=Leucothrix arctica TaxID=1481894 RepID=A0A317C4G5_9GAMM|nr:sensor histidine kinase [Leucothrix arctica]PWQ93197.1 histidine kinase [Leucothrix arctica]